MVVTRDEFNHWLASHDGLLDTLEDAEIDLSCKSDLFDVLDADMSGELEFEERLSPSPKRPILCRVWVNKYHRTTQIWATAYACLNDMYPNMTPC